MVFGTVEHDLHHMRRNALIGHFTKRSIGKLAPYISATVQKLCDRFQDASKTGEIINLQNAYSSLAEDTIYEYCFSSSQNTISIPNFNAESHDYTIAFVKQLCMVCDLGIYLRSYQQKGVAEFPISNYTKVVLFPSGNTLSHCW